jgi:hypothetical protein
VKNININIIKNIIGWFVLELYMSFKEVFYIIVERKLNYMIDKYIALLKTKKIFIKDDKKNTKIDFILHNISKNIIQSPHMNSNEAKFMLNAINIVTVE